MPGQAAQRPHAAFIWLAVAVLILVGALGVRPAGQPGTLGGSGFGARQIAWEPTATASLAGDPSPRAAFAALQRRADGPLAVHWDARSGIPEFLAVAHGTTALPYNPTAAEVGKPVAIARGFLDENRALFGLTGVAADFDAGTIEPDRQRGYATVRLRQVFHGVPVYGRQLLVHLDPQQRIVAVNGQFSPAIDVPAEATIGRDAAEAVALEDLLGTQLDADERARVVPEVLRAKTALTVYVDAAGKPTLAWGVTIMTEAPLGQWRSFVNARRPVVIHRFDSIANAKVRRTYSADNTTEIPGRLLIEEGERSRDAIAQAAHDGAGTVYDYFATKFGRDGIDDRGSPIVSTVHYGTDPEEQENAAWVGEAGQMIYGDGGRIFKPLPYGLDVVGHELTHGIIDNTAELIYQGQSGALNESYADVFGVLIAGSNWTVGAQVVKSPPWPLPYLRSLEDPNARGSYDPSDPLQGLGQPAHMREYANLPLSRRADNGGVHINSGIPNRAAFLVAQALGNEKTEQIYYRTLTQYLTPDADFLDAARATIRAATELYGQGEADAVRNAFAQVGLDANSGNSGPTPPSPSPPAGGGAPQSPAPVPAGCTNIVANGGFEGEGGWEEYSSAETAIIDPQLPRTGARSAWLGGTDQEPTQYIFQDIAIPAGATRVELAYHRLIHRETTGILGGFAGDADFAVLITDPNTGDVVAELEQLSSAQGDDTWRESRLDLSSFAGRAISLVFYSENPRGNVSSFFVDDVSVVACATGSGPAAPSTGSADLVYIQGCILDADTGRGVAGARVIVLRPGVSANQAARDNRITADEALTSGTTDRNGLYRTDAPIQRGRAYSVIVIAGDYRSVVADDGLKLPANATNPFAIDATIRRGR
jgi:Zn-dependent metalloprotease